MSNDNNPDNLPRQSWPAWRAELEPLCELTVENRLAEADRDRIERLVASDPAAKQFYVDYMHQHACLSWAAAQPAMLRIPNDSTDQQDSPTVQTAPVRLPRWIRIGSIFLSSAAALALGLWIGGRVLPKTPTGPKVVATLTSTTAAKWSGGTLPTENGAKLTAGRLRLAEGVARLKFASGAEISLEGPAELELVSRDKCVLASGRLVANVPKQANGFVVETEAALLKELGTEFGVSVGSPTSVDVVVFDGRVDVQERSSNQIKRITEGNTARVSDQQVVVYPSSTELAPLPTEAPTTSSLASNQRIVQITNAIGRGKDAFVLSGGPVDPELVSPGMMQVKCVAQIDSPSQRKGYIAFDLAPLAGQQILGARLDLTLIPTLFSSRFPDATFAVYGMTDDELDDWDEMTMHWATAPGNAPGGAGVDPAKTVLLGKFTVEQGQMSGTFGVDGDALRQFLNKDRNGLATMIVVRETGKTQEKSVIHGFANRRNMSVAPPTLRLTLSERTKVY